VYPASSAVNRSVGANAIISPATEIPGAFFVDGQPHHRARQAVAGRRDARRCVKTMDARTCRSVRVYHDSRRSTADAAALPCGK